MFDSRCRIKLICLKIRNRQFNIIVEYRIQKVSSFDIVGRKKSFRIDSVEKEENERENLFNIFEFFEGQLYFWRLVWGGKIEEYVNSDVIIFTRKLILMEIKSLLRKEIEYR